MPGPAASIQMTPTEFQQLAAWERAGTTPQRLARRARVILGSAGRCSDCRGRRRRTRQSDDTPSSR